MKGRRESPAGKRDLPGERRLTILLLAPALLVLLGASFAHPQPQVAQRLRRDIGPLIALTALPSGNVFALEARGGLYRLAPGASHVVLLKQDLGFYEPVDMTGGRVGDEEKLFITMYFHVGQSKQQAAQIGIRGKLVEYSLEGKEGRVWNLPPSGPFSVALDAQNQVLYLGDSRTSKIYALKLSLSNNLQPTELLQIPAAANIGVLAVDAQHDRLFAADVAQGRVYAIDLQKRRARKIGDGFGEPAAMGYDADQHRLYVADAGKRRVWVLNPDAPSQKPAAFAPSMKEFKEPRGLALDEAHRVWIGDYGARAIFLLSPTGQLANTIRD